MVGSKRKGMKSEVVCSHFSPQYSMTWGAPQSAVQGILQFPDPEAASVTKLCNVCPR